MPAIEVRAREFSSTAELTANYLAARAALWRPSAAVVDFPIDMRRARGRKITFHPTECFGDDDYARFINLLAPQIMRVSPKFTGLQVCDIVARHFGLTRGEIRGKARHQKFIIPRHVAMYLCVHVLGFSFPLTGRIIGNRDHTTVLYAFQKMQRRIAADQDFAAEVGVLAVACGVCA